MYTRERVIEKLKNLFEKGDYSDFIDEGSSREVFIHEDYVLKVPIYSEDYNEELFGRFGEIEYKFVEIEKYKNINNPIFKEIEEFLKNTVPESVSSYINGINQNISEFLTWESSSNEIKSLLAPIKDFFFYKSLPIVVMQKAKVYEFYLDEFGEDDGLEYEAALDDYYEFENNLLATCRDLVSDLCHSNCGLIDGEIKMIDYGLNAKSNFVLI
jgi:hypothetical protein